ncbi:MAG: magnesium transporter [Tissierellia bacterium]|nr:magnesium transporter [Tissierellia bacterium]
MNERIPEEQILQLIQDRKLLQVRELLADLNEVDIAELLEEIDDSTTVLLFRLLNKDLAAEVFAYFSIEKQVALIESFTDVELKHIWKELYFDDIVDIIDEVPANVAKKMLGHSNKEERAMINEFLQYPEHSAGSIMTIEYVALRPDWTVKDAIDHLRAEGIDKETIYTCYVTLGRLLKGIVSLRKLVTSPRDVLVRDLMTTDVISVNTHDDQEEVAALFTRYGFIAIPAVDSERRLVGIITVDDIMDVMEDEVTEDFQKMAAISPSEEPYLETGVIAHSRNRIVWLLVLMISATFTGSIIDGYNDMLAQVLVLSAFIPMIMGTGGNAGAQSSTLVIRGISLGEIEFKDLGKVALKEFQVSALVGVALAFANFLRLYYISKVGMGVSLAVSLTLILTVVLAKIIGGALPLLAQKIKIDPAVMASSVITTIVDAASLIIYFNIAKAILKF